MREAFEVWMLEAGRTGVEGYVEDWIAMFLPAGFELTEVDVPAFSWFGERDRTVPREASDFLAAQLPRCESIGCPECGHFVPVAHWPEILDRLTGD
jgi:pimeloyl-ACP methyl ester carboxylesterase